MEIPAETCEGGLGAARPTNDTASQYITADKPEITATFTGQELTSFPAKRLILTSIPFLLFLTID